MAVNRDKPDRWKDDIARLVDFYNEWFLEFAPKTFRDARAECVEQVRSMMRLTDQLRNIPPAMPYSHPETIHTLRMCTAPPLARDRLIGLADVRKYLVNKMEKEQEIPPTYKKEAVLKELGDIVSVVQRMLDQDIFVWIEDGRQASDDEEYRAATVVADRLTGAVSDPIIRNAQVFSLLERKPLSEICTYLSYESVRELEEMDHLQYMRDGVLDEYAEEAE